ncbi:MAG: OmpA family protein [Paracoccaceae bacterium]
MRALIISLFAGLMILALPMAAQSEETGTYKAAIWIDPDGCEHWVLDLGVEGMMSPHLDRNGTPVCGRSTNICMEFPGDMLFEVDKAVISQSAMARLRTYFNTAMRKGSSAFVVAGHTDSDGSDAHNDALSRARANAVAAIASESGAAVQTRAYGEANPIATNDTSDGKRRNRRVEIMCQ